MEQRAFKRMKTNIVGVIFCRNAEFNIKVIDVSRNGIGLKLDFEKQLYEFNAHNGDEMVLYLADVTQDGNDILTCNVFEIKHIEEENHGVRIGCEYVRTQGFCNYNDYFKFLYKKFSA